MSRLFESFNWTTVPNTFYVDKDEHKGREVDLVAWYSLPKELDERGPQLLQCATVSVKQSVERPWVIFTSPTTIRDCVGGKFLTILSKEVDAHWPKLEHPSFHPISRAERVGRTSHEGFSKGKEKGAITEALLTSVKAAVSEYEKQVAVFGAKGEHRQSFIFQPVVVLSGRLFECYANLNDELILGEVSQVRFVCNYTSVNYDRRQYLVDFVTVDGLRQFLAEESAWLVELRRRAYDA